MCDKQQPKVVIVTTPSSEFTACKCRPTTTDIIVAGLGVIGGTMALLEIGKNIVELFIKVGEEMNNG